MLLIKTFLVKQIKVNSFVSVYSTFKLKGRFMFHCRDLVNYGMLALVGVYFLLFPTPLGMENDIILKIFKI